MTTPDLTQLAATMRANSERWFPGLHHDPLLPLAVFYALGLGGEAGEVLDEIKKAFRTNGDLTQRDNLAAELADVLTYLLLLADELDIDLIAAYQTKAAYNEARWGQPPPPRYATGDRVKLVGLTDPTWRGHDGTIVAADGRPGSYLVNVDGYDNRLLCYESELIATPPVTKTGRVLTDEIIEGFANEDAQPQPTEHPIPRSHPPAPLVGDPRQTCVAHLEPEPCPTCRAYIAGGL